MGKHKSRRRRIVVNSELQGRITMSVSWPPAICLALTALLLGVFCVHLSNEAIDADVDLPSIIPVFMTVMGFLVMATVFILINAIRLSHRIVGPMHRMKMTLHSVTKGHLKIRATLRKRDFLVELADDINEFLDWLEEHPPAGVELIESAGSGELGEPGEASEASEVGAEREAEVVS